MKLRVKGLGLRGFNQGEVRIVVKGQPPLSLRGMLK
jgi:hypothetical protein